MAVKVTPLGQFLQDNDFVDVVREIRINKNGYPYVTCLNEDNKAENVYFTKTASARVKSKSFDFDTEMPKAFGMWAEYSDDREKRMKITFSNRISVKDLFGLK